MIGYSRYTNEYMLWDGATVVKARAIQRMKRDLRWHREGLEKISVDVHSKYPPVEAPESRSRSRARLRCHRRGWKIGDEVLNL